MHEATPTNGADTLRLLIERVLAGEARALGRALSLVETGGSEGAAVLEAAIAAGAAHGRKARRIGITGPPGAGKSTLTDAMVRALRLVGKTVGVIAIDPTSPYTGGALLGDRIRMQGFTGDAGVTIRSMATRGALGGVARTADAVAAVMEAAGREVILIETVGVGQDEVSVSGITDVTVLVLVPGLGDDVQSLKAGIMESADLYVVNKSDLPGAERVEQEIVAMQSLAHDAGWLPPVVRTTATTGGGVDVLLATVDRFLSQAGERRKFPNEPGSSMTAAPRLDHLGIAVRSIAQAKKFYELLGMSVTHEETVEHEQVKTAMLPVGDSRIELLEPTVEESTIGRFLAKRGEGLHHVALRVADVDARFNALQLAGIRLASDQVRVGAGGHRYFFVHPASTGGVLLELVGD